MMESGIGEIKELLLFGSDFINTKIQYEIDISQYLIDIAFLDELINTGSNENSTKTCKILLQNQKYITLVDCYAKKYSSIKTTLGFSKIFVGDCFVNFINLNVQSMEYIINANPIPLSAISFMPPQTQIDCINMKVLCDNLENDVRITLASNIKKLNIEKFDTIFFNLMEAMYLCNGYYPYIEKILFLYNNHKIELHEQTIYIYTKGASFSHWNKEIVCNRDLNINELYYEFMENKKGNSLTVSVLSNVVHARDLASDIVLSLLIQCTEGYMIKWHSPDIKKLTCIEHLENAFEFNKFTKKIVEKERHNNKLDLFLQKAKNTRNEFAHMGPKNMVFSEPLEIYKATKKFNLLLRILVLSDLNIPIVVSDVDKILKGINEDNIIK